MRKIVLLVFLLSLSYNFIAQNTQGTRIVTGKVIDRGNEPLMGVTVREIDGKGIAVTDLDGMFTVSLQNKAEVSIKLTYIGYKAQTILVGDKSEIIIQMEDDAQMLDEMVVIGYGTQKRASLTSSIETIKSEDLLKIPTANVDQALVGQVSGLNVMSTTGDPTGREASISVRGIAGDPLLVIDGVPRFGTSTTDSETRLSDLNPDDIESISILKDAAAAAVYGARAAQGVILVTTKRGKGDKKTRVNYRGQYNLQKATKYPEFLNAYEFAQLFNKALGNSPDFEGKYNEFTADQLEMIRTNSAPYKYGNENLIDYLKDYGYSMTHSLSMSGGGEDLNYYISGGYTDIQGLYSGVGRSRYNYSVKLDANLAKGLKVTVDALGSRSDNKNTSYTTIDAAYNFAPTQLLQYPDGRLTSINGSNPLVAVDGLGGHTQRNNVLNTLTAMLKYDLPWVKGLSAYVRATFDTNNSRTKTFSDPVALYMEDKMNSGEIIVDPNTVYPKGKSTITEREQNLDNKLFEVGVNYVRTFAVKHNVSGMLLGSYHRTDSRYLSGFNDNMSGSYPVIIGSGVMGTINGNESRVERASWVGRVTYNFDYRYFVEANFRVDASTKFPPENRWEFFPSISGAWAIANERFFKDWDQDVISNLKVRASTGLLGSDAGISDFNYQMRYIYSSLEGYGFNGESIKQGIVPAVEPFPNIDIKMENRRDYNLATDMGFWDNRFGITYEYYWRYHTGMLRQIDPYLYPPSAGSGSRYPNINMGKVKEWGWDLTINHRNTIGKVKYNADLMIAKMDNKIVDWGDESSLDDHKQRTGKPYMTWQLLEADGLFRSWEEIENYPIDQDGSGNLTLAPGDIKYKDQDGDEKISTTGDAIYVRNSSYPDFSLSFKLGAEYKGFFISAMFQGVTGYKKQLNEMYSLYNNSLQRFQNYHRDDTWSEENPNAKYPRITFAATNSNNRKPSTFWIEDCDFIRLRSLSIGYNFPANMLRYLKVSGLNISLQGSNLFTWSTLKGLDPESLRGYPIQRTYGASLNIKF